MTEKKELSFRKRLLYSSLILFCIMLFLGSVICIVFYRYAAVYEVTRPEKKMDELMGTMSASDWYSVADRSFCEEISEFENTEEIFGRFYSTFCADKELSYREAYSENPKTEAKFVVRAGSYNLYEVCLKARDEAKPGFGRHYWTLGSVKLADFTSNLQSVKVEIYAQTDDSVFINAIPVGSNYYSENTAWPGLSETAGRFSSLPDCRKYIVEKVFADIAVMDEQGNNIEAEYDADSGVYRYISPPPTYAVTIEAPEDATVLLNGLELGKNEVISVKDSLFRNLTEYTEGNEWDSLVYSVGDIYGEPTITAVDSKGRDMAPVVTDSGRIIFFHGNDPELQENAEASVERFFNAYMNYSSSRGRVYDLLDCTLGGTRLNSYFRYSTEGMYWASDTKINYDELEFSNFYPLNENCLYCTIQFKGNFSAQAWNENYSYEMRNGYEMVFVRYGNTWFAAEMCAFE